MAPTPDWTPTRLARIRGLFEQALDAEPPDLDAFLEAAAPDDDALRQEVRALLSAHRQTGATLHTPISRESLSGLSDRSDRSGSEVGSYRVVRQIGVGGMGVVYEGTRADEVFDKRVAIKFLRRGVESELAVRRFRYERQILANLSHPHIGALLDGGVTNDGQPYFVMEYIQGRPVTEWCDTQAPSLRGRLLVFLQICRAVQHAHQHLVVHRDLKPGNILVTDEGTVKLLDFGIAKLLREEEGTDQLPATQGGARVFTPEYASPEQVRGLPVGVASDVYALGVLLFELVTGRRPFGLQGKLIAEIEQIVCTTPPPRPSDVLTHERWHQVKARSAAALHRRVAGDLDAIILLALRKEPERRYGSVDDMARDVEALLDDRPVRARPEGWGYRAGKWLRRHPVESIAAALLLCSLVGGMVFSTRQARAADRQRDRSTAVTDFFTAMLAAPDPARLGRTVTMREVLDTAAFRADSLDHRPELAAEVREVIGDTYYALGEYDAAVTQFEAAHASRRILAPRGDYATAALLSKLSVAWTALGNYPLADSILDVADTLFRRHADRDDPSRAAILSSHSALQQEVGNLDSAEVLQRAALAFLLRVAPDNDSALANDYNDLGVIVGQQGKFVAAESLHVLAVAAARRAYGEEHPAVASVLSQHAFALEMAGRYAESDSVYQAAIAMRRRVLGPEHPDYAWSLFQYAQFLSRRGDWRGALARGREVLALRGKTLPETHPAVSTALQVVGLALSNLDSLDSAERYLRESLELRRATFGADHWLTASGEAVLGEHLTRARRFAEAERLLLGAEHRLTEVRGAEAPQTTATRERLVQLYTAWHRPEQAAQWAALLPADTP
ncbi:MAG TPA: serine/threonine-protein kinase [Gemmatimonadales bacterium]|nr:serine/threonine-protein kinase [Gemmatimonadales bacterium]